MPYYLDCDSCEFSRQITDEIDTYAIAKDHESEYPDHFVYVLEEP